MATGRSERSRAWVPVIWKALLYAAAIAALVVWWPGPEHTFIYVGF